MNEVICTTASESVRNEGTADLLLIKGGSQNVEINGIKTRVVRCVKSWGTVILCYENFLSSSLTGKSVSDSPTSACQIKIAGILAYLLCDAEM